jgi:hypothetical protein
MLEGTYVVYFYHVSISLYNGFINVNIHTHTHIDETIIQADRNIVEIDKVCTEFGQNPLKDVDSRVFTRMLKGKN